MSTTTCNIDGERMPSNPLCRTAPQAGPQQGMDGLSKGRCSVLVTPGPSGSTTYSAEACAQVAWDLTSSLLLDSSYFIHYCLQVYLPSCATISDMQAMSAV